MVSNNISSIGRITTHTNRHHIYIYIYVYVRVKNHLQSLNKKLYRFKDYASIDHKNNSLRVYNFS